ncbi:T9SS type A sorting domain-containing protein [candidate division KSB1 bacterium]|nr:T9SS type A sorting domain-containing protein [candidate division KSB1 bacterium]
MKAIFFRRFYCACIGFLLIAGERTCGEDNILWDYLYHNDPQNYEAAQEFVPFEEYTFRSVDQTGKVYSFTAVTISVLCDWGDLTSANVIYSTGGSDTYLSMSWVKNVTTSFHGQPSRTYDLWRATIQPQPTGTTVWYRIQVNDGTVSAYLKTNNTYRNPLGQWVRNPDAPAQDNYSYTVENPPIAVELQQFTAIMHQDKVLLSWTTQSEVDLAGFNIVRRDEQGDDFKRMNDCLIRSTGSSYAGAAYQYIDSTRTRGICSYRLEIVKLNGTSEMSEMVTATTAIAVERDNMPTDFSLLQNYPNPFNPQTTIRYVLSHSSDVQLSIYDTNGHLIRCLVNEAKLPGMYTVVWDGRDATGCMVPSGVYIYQLKSGKARQVRKMTLLE